MPADDLDFFLLDIVSTGNHGLPVFDIDIPDLGQCLNCHVPHFTRSELIAALLELFEAGDVEALVEQPRGRLLTRGRRSTFRPNGDEIEAGIAGAISMSYRLTPQGGERWAQIAGIDWKLWDHDNWLGSHVGSITAGDREFAGFLLEKELREGAAHAPVSWKEVRPWKPVEWHEEAVGYQVRYRLSPGKGAASGPRFPADWNVVPASPSPPPVLSPRRQRPPVPEVRPFQSLSDKQLASRVNHRSVLTRLAAATELGRRPDSTVLLIELLRRWCPAIRFAAAKALGRRRVRQAVPALLGAVFGWQDVGAAEALGRIGDRRALGPLLTMFECWRGHALFPDPKFFEAVERAVVQFGDKAIGRLERLARKSGLQKRLLCALGHSHSQRAVQLLIQKLPEHFEPAVDRLARMGDSARTHLFQVATDDSGTPRSRETAARALSESPGAFQEEGRRIAEALHQDRTRTFHQTMIALAIKGDARAKVENPVEALTALLRHPSWAKRRAAVNGLGGLEARIATHDIAQLCEDERWEVRASVARVLARWGQPEEALERLRGDPDIMVRGWARGYK